MLICQCWLEIAKHIEAIGEAEAGKMDVLPGSDNAGCQAQQHHSLTTCLMKGKLWGMLLRVGCLLPTTETYTRQTGFPLSWEGMSPALLPYLPPLQTYGQQHSNIPLQTFTSQLPLRQYLSDDPPQQAFLL